MPIKDKSLYPADWDTVIRPAVLARAKNRCEQCGVALGDDWHADHRYPFSKGGPTEISNGAALCAGCNLRKGAKVLTRDEG